MPKQKIDFRRGLSSTIPSEIIPGTILIETDTGNMYIDDTETSRVQIKDSTKLPLTGGNLTGPLGLGGNVISNVGAPVADADAVNKRYVDVEFQAIESEFATALQSYLQLKGGTMQGSLNMGGFSLTNLEAPVDASDAATKQYVDSQMSGSGQGDFLSNGSIPMTGNLQMNSHKITGVSTPTEDTDAANKQYVDEHSSSGGADETIYTANGISIQPSNQPFNIGASSGSAGDVGHQVNELYAQYGEFSSLSSDYLLSKDISVDSLSVGPIPFARRSSASNFDLEIGNNDTADHVSILAKQGINLILPSSYSLKFVYDEIISGCHLLPSPNGTINIGARNIRFNEIFCNTINAESKVLTDKISPITNATSLDLSGFGSLKLRNGEVILDTYSGSDHVLELGSSVYSRTSLVSDSKIVLSLTGNGGSELYYATINGRRYLFENNPLVVCDLGTSTGRFGTVYCESVSESSDADSKSDIHYLDSNNRIATRSVTQDSQITTQDVINFVKNLDPATFIYKRDGVSTVEQAMSDDPDIIHLGIIANDIENDPLFNYVASKVTSTVEDKTEGEIEKTVYSIKPASLAVAALTACKYLLNKVEELENKLTAS